MKTLDEKRSDIHTFIDNYKREVGIGKMQSNTEVNKFLNMTGKDQKRLDAEECGEAAITLNQCALYLQLQINELSAELAWCKRNIEYLIAETISKVGEQYTPFEYRRIIAIKNNDVAMKLQIIINDLSMKIESIQYLPNHLKSLSMSFADLQQTKRIKV